MFKKLLEMKSVVFAWMVSYLVILIIPIIISIVVFFNIEHIIEEEVLTSNTYMLEQIRREADNILDEVRKTYTDLTFDYNINRVLNFQGSLTDEQYYQIYMAQEVVKRLKLANIYLGDTAVYLQKSDMVISYNSISDSRTYYNIYFKDSGLTYGQWLDQVTAYYDNPAYVSVRKLNDKQQVREQIMCLKSVGYEQTSEMLTAICMIDQELLSDYFSNVRSQYNSFTNIIDAQNHFLLSDAQNQRFLGLASEMLSEGGSVSYQTIDGERYVISYIHSGTSDWKYVCAVPQREFSKKNQPCPPADHFGRGAVPSDRKRYFISGGTEKLYAHQSHGAVLGGQAGGGRE